MEFLQFFGCHVGLLPFVGCVLDSIHWLRVATVILTVACVALGGLLTVHQRQHQEPDQRFYTELAARCQVLAELGRRHPEVFLDAQVARDRHWDMSLFWIWREAVQENQQIQQVLASLFAVASVLLGFCLHTWMSRRDQTGISWQLAF